MMSPFALARRVGNLTAKFPAYLSDRLARRGRRNQ
jgi:hypothetical protein